MLVAVFYPLTEEQMSFQNAVLVLLLLIPVYFSHFFIFCRTFSLNILCVTKKEGGCAKYEAFLACAVFFQLTEIYVHLTPMVYCCL